MVTFVELASLIWGRWCFHSSEAALPLIRSFASTHWKRCKRRGDKNHRKPLSCKASVFTDVPMDAHHHPASKLAAADVHQPAALRAILYTKTKTIKTFA